MQFFDTRSPTRTGALRSGCLSRSMALIVCGVLMSAGSLQAASFDCKAEALKEDEKAICDTLSLNDADVRMVTTFDILSGLLAMGARGTMQDEQTAWLKNRQECKADIACLTASYEKRMLELDATFKNLKRPL